MLEPMSKGMSEPLSDKQLDKIRKELAKHRRWGRAAICCHCGESWPCTSQSYTGLLAEVDRLRAQVCRCPDDRIRLGHHLGHDAVERAARALYEQRYGWGDNEEWTDPDVQEIYNEEARAALIAAGPNPDALAEAWEQGHESASDAECGYIRPDEDINPYRAEARP